MSASSAVAQAWRSASHIHWRHLAARCKAWTVMLSGRRDVIVAITPAGTPSPPAGVFNHVTTTITLDACQTLPGRPDPAHIDLRDGGDRARHPVLAGVLAHEIGHALHTHRRGHLDTGLGDWPALLEEPRMEGRVVATFPTEARQWLRASVEHILGTVEPSDSISAARVLILLGGRVLADVLDEHDIPDLDELLKPYLTVEQIAVIGLETARAVAAADGDLDTLISAARRIAALFPDHTSDDCDPDDDTGGHSPGGADIDPDGAVRRALRAISSSAARDLRLAAGVREPSPAAQARARATAARHATVVGDHQTATETRHPSQARPATGDEQHEYRALLARLKAAQTREQIITQVASIAPPGRLRTAALVQRAGQAQAGLTPTATPWSSPRRRTVDSPPLVLGIALDISESMEPYAEPTAAAGWMFARAVRQLDGEVATVTWNTSVSLMQPPGRSTDVQIPEIGGGSSGLPSALRALERTLMLDRARGARVVAIITDGDLWNPEEVYEEVDQLIMNGVRVLWLTSPDSYDVPMDPPTGVTAAMLDDPSSIGRLIGDCAVKALQM
ncbi:VWA domain-containing protein [Nocardia sp. NPDC052566]|uniref:VWA domain-containing protein n=1 Tax=Nocardia sp. NPDC052566 TaxID=3364330 RepID=UPI0037C597C2